jgi:hypothetical protein
MLEPFIGSVFIIILFIIVKSSNKVEKININLIENIKQKKEIYVEQTKAQH